MHRLPQYRFRSGKVHDSDNIVCDKVHDNDKIMCGSDCLIKRRSVRTWQARC